MRYKQIIDSIDDYKSAVFLCIYRGGGWTRYKQTPRANSVNLANKHSKKLGILFVSAHTRTVRTVGWTVRRLISVLNNHNAMFLACNNL
jgi:hypothetical protein